MLTDLISFDTMMIMSKKPIDNPVTETVFNREIQALHKRMDSVDSSAGRMTHELLKTKEEVQDIKKSMSTKDDINTVLGRMTHELLKTKEEVQDINTVIGRMTHELLKTKEEVQDIKKSMSTKDDINTVLNRIDAFTTRIETFDRKVIVHDDRLAKTETKLT